MADHQYTEVTHQSWFGRIGQSVKGIVVGLVFFVLAFPLLFWNEGRSVERYKTLEEGAGQVVSISADRVDPANDGRLVHVNGRATTDAVLEDPEFGVSANAIHLRRSVAMYQWEEESESREEKKLGGGSQTTTTYTYSKTWSERPIDSSRFKRPGGHDNPVSMPYRTWNIAAKEVALGAFRLSASLIAKINNYEPLNAAGDGAPSTMAGLPVHVSGNEYYLGQSPSQPEIGDMKVSFEVARPTPVSLMARQYRDTFEPFHAEAGGSIELLQVGTVSSQAMIKRAQEENKVITWILRAVGFFMMFLGLALLLKPLSVLADVVPFIGDLVGAGTGFVAFSLAALCALLTIATAWLFYRPLFAIALVVIAVGLVFGMRTLARRKATA